MTKALLQLVRAPNGLTAVSNILAAAVIASSGQVNFSVGILIIASLAFYYGGMTLNDCFDYREDLAERNKRPLPSGQISLTLAWLLGFGLLAVGLGLSAFFAWPNLTALFIGLALSLSIILYNSLIKNGLTGSIMMGLCRYFNWLLGASFVLSLTPEINGELNPCVFLLALPILLYITGLTYLSKQETHATDKKALLLTSLFMLATAVSQIILLFTVLTNHLTTQIIGTVLVCIWLALLLKRLIPLWFNFTPDKIQAMIMYLIIGVIPLDALMLAISGYYLWALVVIALLPPCRVLSKHLYMT
ncbi:UbiA family prenyltransferase [Catenovulum sp. 2E275]|uniref:UbiA family prenyltransferase n=1 Tax=Catenovulum sp. 2E275 TaxID=2980497 RepID=UPI0021D3C8D0|nr:UbiA family prenyltransferase [Catenovulum sp. 2E275]MCU4676156.1 UbiA family prenyltransferase [Catenovulum sp. 2E275]